MKSLQTPQKHEAFLLKLHARGFNLMAIISVLERNAMTQIAEHSNYLLAKPEETTARTLPLWNDDCDNS